MVEIVLRMRRVSFVTAMLLVVAGLGCSSCRRSLGVKLVEEGAIGWIPIEERSSFDFSQDGSVIWLIDASGKTNCYDVATCRNVDSTTWSAVSPPIERLYWTQKLNGLYYDASRMRSPVFKRDSSDRQKGKDGVPDIFDDYLYFDDVQLYGEGCPMFVWHRRLPRSTDCWVLCQTDFDHFRVEKVLHNIPSQSCHILCSQSRSSHVDCHLWTGWESRYVTFYPWPLEGMSFGQSEVDDSRTKPVTLTMKDIADLLGDDALVTAIVFYLSDDKVAIAASSVGRTSFFGRSYLMIYDFSRQRVVWKRKTRNELSKLYGTIWWNGVRLSSNERFLAISVGRRLYLHDLSGS